MNQNGFYSPSRKILLLFNLIWFIGTVLLVAVMTDLFTESPFQGQYLMLHFLVIASTVMVGRLNYNYSKMKTAA